MDADDGVAVAALVGEGQVEVQRSSTVALGHDTGARARAPRAVPPKAPAPARRRAGKEGRGRRDRMPRGGRMPRGALHAPRSGALRPRSRALRGWRGSRSIALLRSIDEDRLRGAARERLDAERTRAGEQIEHACVVQRHAENAEQGLAHAVARGPCLAPRWREQPAAAVRPGDDSHAGSGVRSAVP